tara:strand:+ start:9980 stop:11509 length:1530 start_codon:yes stop_codon:yes gene_type:complete
MAIIAKFTRTLPAPSATISGGFVFLLSAGWFTDADLGAAGSPINGVNAITNGGGDMQIFSDTATTTRLPIEVVSFVTGGSPVAQVWVRTPSYTAGDTITIGKDDTQTVQPAVGAAFGRNAAWVDFDFALHLESNTSTSIDSAGNNDFSAVGVLTDVTASIGDGMQATADNTRLTTSTNTFVATNEWTHSFYFTPDISNNGGTFSFGAGAGSPYEMLYWSGVMNLWDGSFKMSSATLTLGVSYLVDVVISATGAELYIDGVSVDTDATTYSITDNTKVNIGTRFNDGTGSTGAIYDEALFRVGAVTSSYISSKRLNQNDPDNFGTSSEYILVGGSGISVTATLGTIDYNSNDTVIGLTGSIDVTATLGTINYSSNDASIQISGETNVIATLGTIEYSSSDTVISLFGNVDVVATLGTISYDSNDVSIGLTGGISVNATLGTIDYTSNDTAITLQGQVSVISTLGTISYDSNNVTIQVGTGQFIGTVTAGFADDLYSAGFKPSEITVSFKS